MSQQPNWDAIRHAMDGTVPPGSKKTHHGSVTIVSTPRNSSGKIIK